MSEQVNKQQNELANLIERYTGQDGLHETSIPGLSLIRHSDVTGPIYGVQNPSLCIVVQGMKETLLAQDCFRYGPADYLVTSVDLPIIGEVIEASSDAPYLCFKLEFTQSQILHVLSDSEIRVNSKQNSKRAMYVSQTDSFMLDAVTRLVRLLDYSKDIPVLAPLFTKEILYRVLQGQHGISLEQIAVEGNGAYRIRDVIEEITSNYDKSFRVEELAEIANMSVASLHRHFKEVTAMSPIQFQKQLRLQEARRMLLTESTDVTDTALRVGYESASQFSREYSRMFGFPPREDIRRLRGKYNQRIQV